MCVGGGGGGGGGGEVLGVRRDKCKKRILIVEITTSFIITMPKCSCTFFKCYCLNLNYK